jgi:hypothetical protein
MAYLQGVVGGTDNPRLIYTYFGTTTDWDTVPVPAELLPKHTKTSEAVTLLDGTEIDVNVRYRLKWLLRYVHLDRDDEEQFQQAAESTQVLFYPHKDSEAMFEVLIDFPWRRQWAAAKAVGHENIIRLTETTLRRRISDIGEVLAGAGGASYGRVTP